MYRKSLVLSMMLTGMLMAAPMAWAQTAAGVGGGAEAGVAGGLYGNVPQAAVTVEQATSWVADPNFPQWIMLQPNMAYQIAQFPYSANIFYLQPFFQAFAERFPNQGIAIMRSAMEWENWNNQQKANFFRLYPNLKAFPMGLSRPGYGAAGAGAGGAYGGYGAGAAGNYGGAGAYGGAGNYGGAGAGAAGNTGAGGYSALPGAAGQSAPGYGPWGAGARAGEAAQGTAPHQQLGNQAGNQAGHQGTAQK